MTTASSSEPPRGLQLIGRAVRHEMFSVFLAALLCSIAFYALRVGYLKSVYRGPSSDIPHTWPFTATIVPILFAWVFGTYLARRVTILVWLWLCWLAIWTLDTIGKMDGDCACIWCDPGVEVLLFVTVVWIGLASTGRLVTRARQIRQSSRLTSFARPEVLSVLAAAVLYAISYHALSWGYANNSGYSDIDPLRIDPSILWISLAGFIGVYITRKIPIVPWIWVGFLIGWTYYNFYSFWGRFFFIDGYRGCVSCDESAISLLFFTAIWVLVALLSWLTMFVTRVGETK